MFAVLVNVVAVLVGSTVGLIFKKGIPEKVAGAVMIGLGFCTIYIGIDGALVGENPLILISSMVIGAIIGTVLDIDGRLNRLSSALAEKTVKDERAQASVANAFITASLVFCVGSMSVVGSLNAGLTGDNQLLYTKSMLDLVSSAMLSVSLGIGVMFAAVTILVFQGAIALLASVLAPFLSTAAVNEMTCVGSVLIIALGFNLVGIAKFKVADYLPAIVVAPVEVGVVGLVKQLLEKM